MDSNAIQTEPRSIKPVAEMRPDQVFLTQNNEYAQAFEWLSDRDRMDEPCGFLIQAAQFSTLAFTCGFHWPSIVSIDIQAGDDINPYEFEEYCHWCVGGVSEQDEAALAIVDVAIRNYLRKNGWLEVTEERYFHSLYQFRDTLEALELTVESLRLGASYIKPSGGAA